MATLALFRGGPELAEALRVLKPGGQLFLMDARPDPGAFRKIPPRGA